MKRFLNFISCFAVFGLCVKNYFLGNWTVEFSGGLMIVIVILAALDSPIGYLIKAIVTVMSFGAIFIGYVYNSNDFMAIIQPILTMLIALYGIYYIIGRVFGVKSSGSDEINFTFNKRTGKFKNKDNWW